MDSPCTNQNQFNDAFKTALDNYKSDEMKKYDSQYFRTTCFIFSLTYLIFMIWAVILALKISKPDQRILHVTLALISGPAYVFGYYISK